MQKERTTLRILLIYSRPCLMPGWWQASIQATTVKAKGRERKGNEGLSLLSRDLWKLFSGVCCKGYQGWTCSWKSWANNFFKWLLLPDEIVCYRLHNSTGTFCVWAKALKQTGNDFSTLTENSSILVHETFECRGPLTLGVRGFFFSGKREKARKSFFPLLRKKRNFWHRGLRSSQRLNETDWFLLAGSLM